MSETAALMLPELLGTIAEVAGEEAALLVAKEFGGVYLYLPKTLEPTHRLVEVVGEKRARLIHRRFGYGSIVIPLGPYADASRRRLIIERALAKGESHSVAARAAGVHVRTVERVAAELRQPQSDLFQIK